VNPRMDNDIALALFHIECALDMRQPDGWGWWSYLMTIGEW
jgi:hypothetical protein